MDSNEEYTQRQFFQERLIKTSESPEDKWEVIVLKSIQLDEEINKQS